MGQISRMVGSLVSATLGDAVKRRLAHQYLLLKMRGLSRKDRFEYIYRNRIWGDGEFDSGEGSIDRNSELYVAAVRAFVLENPVRTIVDVGCGDFRVGQRIMVGLSGVSYLGVDIASSLIARNNKAFGAINVRFEQLDVVEREAPAADLYLIREVLQHLSNADVARALSHVHGDVLITEVLPACYKDKGFAPNKDIASGHMTRVEKGSGLLVSEPPFSLPSEVLLSAPSRTDPSKHLLTLRVRRP